MAKLSTAAYDRGVESVRGRAAMKEENSGLKEENSGLNSPTRYVGTSPSARTARWRSAKLPRAKDVARKPVSRSPGM